MPMAARQYKRKYYWKDVVESCTWNWIIKHLWAAYIPLHFGASNCVTYDGKGKLIFLFYGFPGLRIFAVAKYISVFLHQFRLPSVGYVVASTYKSRKNVKNSVI